MSEKTIIKNITSGQERAFYAARNTIFENIIIDGKEDGESSFKECRNISITNSKFNLRYPFWHDYDLTIVNSHFSENTRASFWYSDHIVLNDVICLGPKAIRECKDVVLKDCEFNSDEFGWKCEYISLFNSKLTTEYGFFESKKIVLENVEYKGKYSFQYTEDVEINNSNLDTKDAFWHSENVTVTNSIIKGEYLGWYSKNLTLINCTIIGTQPLCYCEGLTLVDCKFINADLAFEYSEVNGNIIGEIDSIMNPISGKLVVDKVHEIIEDNNSRKKDFTLEIRNI